MTIHQSAMFHSGTRSITRDQIRAARRSLSVAYDFAVEASVDNEDEPLKTAFKRSLVLSGIEGAANALGYRLEPKEETDG